MNVYIYAAALHCEECGETIRATLTREGEGAGHPDNEFSYDSDQFPKGPFFHGGGEADCPQHCDSCGCFLENPLTDDGVDYVREAIADIEARKGPNDITDQWREFYAAELEEAA